MDKTLNNNQLSERIGLFLSSIANIKLYIDYNIHGDTLWCCKFCGMKEIVGWSRVNGKRVDESSPEESFEHFEGDEFGEECLVITARRLIKDIELMESE